MKNIKDQSLSKIELKKVLLRVDLNVPLENGKVVDDTRILKIIDTVIFLLKNNTKIIIISHVGRPNGKINEELSLKPIAEKLEYILKSSPESEHVYEAGQKVRLVKNNLSEITKENLFLSKNEKIVMLENIRFYKGEEKNDDDFAIKLASLGDIYVNDAFSCSHRSHASIDKITNHIPSYAGFQLNEEINALNKITSEIKRPITCIIGGSKISTKINVIKNLIPKLDNIIIVGGMANNILKYKGISIGKSIKEDNCEIIIEEIFKASKKYSCPIYYPEDVMVGKNLQDKSVIKELSEIDEHDIILDIGPNTLEKVLKVIDESQTILWNGPAGYFENTNFAVGSIEIAKKIIEKHMANKIYSVVGGGDTVHIVNSLDAMENFNFVSTAGGAFLEYLEGKKLPGITALN